MTTHSLTTRSRTGAGALATAGAAARDAWLVFAREMRPELRAPMGLIFGMMQPLVFLALFGPLLYGMPGVGSGPPWQWFVPGILVMIGIFGTGSAGYYVLVESGGGSLERMLVTPLSRGAMLIGRTLKEAVTLLAQSALIILAVLPFGFRLYPAGVLAGLALLVAAGVGIGALSFALALAARRAPSLFWAVQQTVTFPLLLLSGVLLPLENAPGWLAAASAVNPMTYIVEAERALFAGDLSGAVVARGALAALAIAAAGLAVGVRAMRRAAL